MLLPEFPLLDGIYGLKAYARFARLMDCRYTFSGPFSLVRNIPSLPKNMVFIPLTLSIS